MGVSTGTAPIPASTLAWLRTVFPDVAEGYGATEVGAITHDDIIVPGVAVKLKDVDGTGWHSGTLPFPTGEVWVRTAAMSSEYLGDAMETDERFDADGFFNTGDIGELDAVHRKLRLIGRSKRYAVGSRLSRFFFILKKTIYLFCIFHPPPSAAPSSSPTGSLFLPSASRPRSRTAVQIGSGRCASAATSEASVCGPSWSLMSTTRQQ
jgi:hypothetical protein